VHYCNFCRDGKGYAFTGTHDFQVLIAETKVLKKYKIDIS